MQLLNSGSILATYMQVQNTHLRHLAMPLFISEINNNKHLQRVRCCILLKPYHINFSRFHREDITTTPPITVDQSEYSEKRVDLTHLVSEY